ncbi:MAG: DNA repair protein RecN [Thermoanaerobaculales bacterium]
MLQRLSVRSLGIIDAVEVEFAPGFAVLTGETGAGKSLLVESLKLLGGQRAQSDLVRTGSDRLQVEGTFSVAAGSTLETFLQELGVAADTAAVLRREVSSEGRSRCWINDVSVTAGAMQRVAPHLLAIHGQHEQHGLADTGVQRGLVDAFGGYETLLDETRGRYAAWQSAAEELDRLRRAQSSRRDRLDVITFQVQEIDAADPHPGEDEELRRHRLVLRHAARLAELSGSLLGRLSEDEAAVVDSLAKAERELAEMVECGLDVKGGAERLAEARVQVEEVVREVQLLVAGTEGSPGELEEVESRAHLLDQLMLKYGSPADAVLAHRESLVGEREELEAVEDRLESAAAAAEVALAEFDLAAKALDTARRKAGKALVERVEKVLARLAMEGSHLEFRWQTRVEASSPLLRDGQPVAFDAAGVEECVLLIAANPGEEPRPMARIASGGELSRMHLALRTVLRSRGPSTGLTLLFDEVDSGLGGVTAAALAELLADLAQTDQVLVVTHLPQVAARAAGHFLVEKIKQDGRAVTQTRSLSGAEREAEVARMLAGGEVTESAHAHARVLLGDV